MTFEYAMNRLEEIVKKLEGQDIPLDKALAEFEDAIGLVKFCNETLAEAELKITQLSGGNTDV